MLSFAFAFFAILGIGLVFHVPVRHLPIAALVGALANLIEQACLQSSVAEILACFLAACGVGLMSDLASRLCKDAATIFIIPGILCLVPGAGMYQTMYALVTNQTEKSLQVGFHTLCLAGAIALGLLVTGGLIRAVVAIARKMPPVIR